MKNHGQKVNWGRRVYWGYMFILIFFIEGKPEQDSNVEESWRQEPYRGLG